MLIQFLCLCPLRHAEFLYIESGLLDKHHSAEQEVVGSNP